MAEHTFALELMFSYLVLIGFIVAIIALTGQSIFGSAFPANPITSQTFTFVNNCDPTSLGYILCEGAFYGGIFLTVLLLPLQLLAYLWSIMMFMMFSPTIWWMGLVLFLPAGIIFLILLIYILIAIAQVIATLIPF
jgi:hypothetical protein